MTKEKMIWKMMVLFGWLGMISVKNSNNWLSAILTILTIWKSDALVPSATTVSKRSRIRDPLEFSFRNWLSIDYRRNGQWLSLSRKTYSNQTYNYTEGLIQIPIDLRITIKIRTIVMKSLRSYHVTWYDSRGPSPNMTC